MAESLLLGTCACLWLTRGDEMCEGAAATVARAQRTRGIFVPAITAWEVAALVRKGRYRLKASVAIGSTGSWRGRGSGRCR